MAKQAAEELDPDSLLLNVHFDSWPGSWSEHKITYSLQPALGNTIAPSVPLTTVSKEQQALIHE